MERRKALTLPLTVEDHMMENPLKIPMSCFSPECAKLEGQVSWTAFSGCKYKSCSSHQKNGSMMFDHCPAAFITLEMTRRKPLLILTDVLKTELGKTYIERVKMSCGTRSRGRLTSAQRESGHSKEEHQTCKNNRSSQRELNNNDKSKSSTPKSNQKITPNSSQRTRVKRRLQNSEEEKDRKKKQDIKEVIISKYSKEEESVKEADDGLNSKFTEDTSCDEFSSESIKDQLTDPVKEEQNSSNRKRKISESRCNGTGSPKRHRESVLRLSGEDGKDGEQVPTSVHREEHEENENLENFDHCIVQFTFGGDDGTQDLVPGVPCNLDAEDKIRSDKQSLSSRHESTTQTGPTEPIVLSSDDEEGRDNPQNQRKVVHVVSDTGTQEKSKQEAVSKEKKDRDIQNMQMLQVVVEESPLSEPGSSAPDVDFSCLSVAFFSLHCGGYYARANGGLTIEKHEIMIPLKDTSEQYNGMLSFERKELKRYSIWDQQELEMCGLRFEDDEEPSCGILLFYVSEAAAAAVQQDLCQLCVKEEGSINTEYASPFILLTLKDPLEGMEGALLRSVLDLDCINNMAHEQIVSGHSEYILGNFVDISTPVLSLGECIELITKTGQDSHLLSMLGIQSTDSEPNRYPDSPDYDENELPTAHIWLEPDFQKEFNLELETEPEDTDTQIEPDEDTETQIEPNEDTETQTEPKEDQKDKEMENPSDSKKEEAQPVYTVCHRRTKGSYSVSLSKPDSKWIKYKHHGLARRLIQFPPPPLKGGITVTMEDLKCLENGQYLNDVIIDFYLKYLIQNTCGAIAERCHIFSSFFYKQLTRRDNASEGGNNDSCQRQRRHQRVKTWTRHVEIFEKDFLFVPVNQEAHWYLVVICFPGLEEPKLANWAGETPGDEDECKSSKTDRETPVTSNGSDSMDSEKDTRDESTKDSPPCPVSCTEQTCRSRTVCKTPCILIMDSLKLSLHERVFKLLREYLQSEWEARRGSSRDFNPDQMKSSHCKVPLQDNSSDCGLYLLQYVECFLKDPVVHFDLPLHLEKWFPRQLVRKKRDEIRDLILNLYRHQNLDNVENKKIC